MQWLRMIGRLFGIVGTLLSVKRWWSTVWDRKSPTGARVLALLLIALTIGMILYSWKRQGFRFPSQAQWVPGQIIVDFKDDTPIKDIPILARRYHVRMLLNSIHAGEEKLFRVEFQGHRMNELLETLNKDPRVEFAEPNFLYRILGFRTERYRPLLSELLSRSNEEIPISKFVPNDPRYKEQWHLQMIGMEEAWVHARGKGVVVAVIDTGVACENFKDFKIARDLKETRFTKGYNFVDDNEHPIDDHGHGTHVTGTIAQSTNNREGVAGVAFDSTIMPLKVLNKQGFGNLGDIADAIRYAADEGAQVINMSLGGPVSSRILKSACEYAEKKGVTIVCAAGNEGRERISYPAAYPSCLAVAAVGPEGTLAPYSSYGRELSLAAPGGDMSQGQAGGVLQNTIINGQDDYFFFQGTSMASPHVAGVAALVISGGLRDPKKVRHVLEETAIDKGDRIRYGAGIVNAARAVDQARAGAHEGTPPEK